MTTLIVQYSSLAEPAPVLYVSFQKPIKAASQFQSEQPINGPFWDTS